MEGNRPGPQTSLRRFSRCRRPGVTPAGGPRRRARRARGRGARTREARPAHPPFLTLPRAAHSRRRCRQRDSAHRGARAIRASRSWTSMTSRSHAVPGRGCRRMRFAGMPSRRRRRSSTVSGSAGLMVLMTGSASRRAFGVYLIPTHGTRKRRHCGHCSSEVGSPEGAHQDSPGRSPGKLGSKRRGSPERATHLCGITGNGSPFQGSDIPLDPGSRGCAPGFLEAPLRGSAAVLPTLLLQCPIAPMPRPGVSSPFCRARSPARALPLGVFGVLGGQEVPARRPTMRPSAGCR